MLIAATDIAGIGWPLAVVAVITIGIGAAVQATIGLGMAVLAAPILALIDPDFLPVTTIVMVMPLSFGVARREHEHIVWSAAGIALFGRLPGVAIGALLISSTGSGTVKLLVGISVLLAVAASATRFHVRTSTRNLLIAGMASGFSGTTAGIGGPPWQSRTNMSNPPRRERPSQCSSALAQ